MEKCSFFDSISGDRKYFSQDWADQIKNFFTNGVFNNGLQVISNNDMTISIKKGNAHIEGRCYVNTDNLVKPIEIADGVLNRIDNVVIRLDLTNRLISAQIIKGTFAEDPTPPALIRTSTIYDIRLATISIPHGTTSITTDLITDTRFINSDCGDVIATVKTADTENLYIQLYKQAELLIKNSQTEFSTWFNSIKNTLNDNVAGNLYNKINTIVESLPKSYIKTLLLGNWVLNEETNYYEYDIIDSNITSNTLVNGYLDLTNQNKITSGYIDSYNGGFKIIASKIPKEDVSIEITYELTNLVLGGSQE